jgi:hypothetical protein
VRHQVLGEPEDALDIERFDLSVMGCDFGDRQLLAKLVALRLVGGLVDGLLVDEHVVQTLQLPLDISDSGAQGSPSFDCLCLLDPPDVEHDLP